MQLPKHSVRRFSAAYLTILLASPALAGPPSDTLLPNTTKGYVTVAKSAEFRQRWDKTQAGQMLNDEVMQPFVEDFKKQLREDVNSFEDKLGLTYDDIKDVAVGETSLALIERKDKPAALAITMDVTGHEKEANGLLAAVEKRLAARGGKKQVADSGGTALQVFTAPMDGSKETQLTVYFIKDNLLCGVDDRAEAEAMLKRFAGNAKDSLSTVPAYTATMQRCQREAKDLQPEVRWFVEPFGFIFAARTLEKTPGRKNDKDVPQILKDNGFDAILGAGGYVNQLVEGNLELLVRASIYAPPVKGKENDPLRWASSMRMMQTPNVAGFEPQSWVPREAASYATIQLRLIDAFDNLGPVFDAMQGHKDAWKNSLEGWETDAFGPQVDVRKAFIQNLGERITIVSSYDTPINESSERAVFAIEAKNEKELSEALEKWMKREPDVEKRVVGQYTIWERVAKENNLAAPEVDVPGFETVNSSADESGDEDRERVLPNSAVTVALGHLMMASDIKYMTEVLEGFAQRERLASSADYQQVLETINRVAPGDRCAYAFGRSDEELRPTFELIRQNRMPESKAMLGKLLNKMFTTEAERQEGVPRKQKIDGSSLPNFEAIRRYFGPHGRVVRSEKDGWFITGVVLNKEAP